jgi:peptide/nickel transport system ATP-binding protein
VLNLISALVRDHGIGLIMISHDLSVLADTCERLAVMYAGRIVEEGPAHQVFTDAKHPYAEALAWAFPVIGDPRTRLSPRGLPGDPPDPAQIPSGCSFHPRCAVAEKQCSTRDMELWPAGELRLAACVRVLGAAGGESGNPIVADEEPKARGVRGVVPPRGSSEKRLAAGEAAVG